MSNPILAHEMRPGHRAMMQQTAARTRFDALGLHRKPTDQGDATRREQMAASARTDRIVMRQRVIYVREGMHVAPRRVWDVLRVAGIGPTARDLEIIASDVWWEAEAVQIAADALRGRMVFGMGGGRRVQLAGGTAGLLTPAADLASPHQQIDMVRHANGDVEIRRVPPPAPRPVVPQ
jgi:hypothetical protein